ncbi:MAG: glycosyltransferase family 39 protein [Chloroflexota bacterium]|nr:glycosyltransferase family 39 protein [Chloroflexota bacterium]
MLSKEDVRNLFLLLLGMLLVLVMLSPARSFPITDDWIYAQSVSDLLNWAYTPHDFSQATALTHVAWGALFTLIFGHGFTVLAYANLVMSGICMLVFYLLLRQTRVRPGSALFGTALLACNPMYVYLSYSFMTDITFLTCMLAACFCYVRGMQAYTRGEDRTGWRWLLAGGLVAALACLTRQFGLLLLPAALGYLWWSRRWTWRRAAAIAAIPLAASAIYLLWDRTHPERLVDIYVNQSVATAIRYPLEYIVHRIQLDIGIVPILGLSLLPIIRLPRRPLYSLPLIALIVLFQIRSFQQGGTILPMNGNIIDHRGLAMLYYDAEPLFPEAVWLLLGITGACVVSFYVVACGEELLDRFRNRVRGLRIEDPALLLYLVAFMLGAMTLMVTFFLYDRYLLPLLPLLMVPELRRLSALPPAATRRLALRWALAAPVMLLVFVVQADYMAHSAARWAAAEELLMQGAHPRQISAGFEWAGQYSYEAGAAYIRETRDYRDLSYPPFAVLDPLFMVADRQQEGYTVIGSVPYESWLYGGEPRRVLMLKRD